MIIRVKSMKNLDKINLDKNQADSLIMRLGNSDLTDFDKSVITHIIYWYFWLQSALLESKISISRIKSMFGFKNTESSKNLEVELDKSSDEDTDADILALLAVDAKDSSEQAPATAPIVEPSNQNSSQDSDEVKKKAVVV